MMDQYRYLANMSENYMVVYIISLHDGTFKRIKSIDSVDAIVGNHKSAQSVMKRVVEYAVYPEFQDVMEEFVDLSTLPERLKENNSVSCEYFGRHMGWCNAQFIIADRDAEDNLREVFFMVTDIQEIKLRSEIYREALESDAEFIFQFDLTDGILTESFASIASKMAPGLEIEFPMDQDEFIVRYYKYLKAKPIEGYNMRITTAGMVECFNQGRTRLETRIYSEHLDRYYSHEFFITRNEATDHIIVMSICRDITKLYKHELDTQEAIAKAHEKQAITNTVLLAFAETYLNVYLVDLSQNLVTIIKDEGYNPENQVHVNERQVLYGPSIEGYIRGRVIEEDQDRVRRLMRPDVVRKNLEGKKEFSFAFQILEEGKVHDFQARIIKTEEDDTYVMGFSNIDDLLVKERHQKEMFQKAAEELKKSDIYLKAISTSYNYMVIYNLTKRTYDTILKKDVMRWNNPKSGNYDELLQRLIMAIPKNQQGRIAESRKVSTQLDNFCRGKMHWVERTQVYDANGELHWMEERVMYTRDPENGDILGVSLSTVVDDEVQRENKYNQITHALVRDYLNVYIIKPQADEMLAISLNGYLMPEMNQQVGVMISYNKMITAYLNDRVVPEDRDRIYKALGVEHIEQTMADKEELVLAYHIMQDGGEHDYQVKIIRTAEKGTYIFGFKNIDDLMTEERRRQKMYREALEEAKRANKAKTDFLARMSHDIRTPINGIVGMTYIMKSQLDNREKIEEAIENIEVLNKQLELLIDDVLEMSSIESGKIQLHHESFELTMLLGKLRPVIQVLEENTGVKLIGVHYDIKHDIIVSSPLHIQRVAMNVLSNAFKYNKKGGSVECWLKETPIDETRSKYMFICKDTGVGMSKEFLEHIYEPFAREKVLADSSTSGTGLGMAITKELVDLFGGTIEIESQEDVGTTVTITATLEHGKMIREEGLIEVDAFLEGKRILLVEDNAMNSKIARFILEEEKAIVESASDGQEAVEMFERSPLGYYSLILMDIMMPVMDGYEATRTIRKLTRSDAERVPIIAMSANAFELDVRNCLEAGMNDHMAKPIDIDLMKKKLGSYR